MRFIDEVYEMYKGHFNGDEEDIVAIIVGILDEQSHQDLIKLVTEMDEEELFHMLATYMIEVMKRKVAMDDERPPVSLIH
ncbi:MULTISPECIES: DUF6154 family protein [Brevibacillus]|jgi:hypothetical protein|uniref:Cytosolic protein n=1 Tax=Brevibacillus borstelensis AK1 TaxID=1300222 RepID=M8E418_9BACL|nr:DUF6154 family protein [Brevibacillus borstelensis]EMT50210.1 hypothetical protein I532_23699 [Brevibacillus borstelensis AK1]KKX54520.1 hypothetical protein X546_14265 [Brevibacillus borstelensis cifa_chp40]MBE5397380.1 hypothetical protein [Brevibacillus borstelensis]MCC0562966.1 DUF6154 family protein [Brevibacillus borstelensis]MCM3470415.1 DUF6154 family protein [Brevibacillus borstelensis]